MYYAISSIEIMRMRLVTAEAREAAIWTTLVTRIVWDRLEQADSS